MTNLPVCREADITAADYHGIPALSNSGLKDLAVSPLRYWHLWINPNKPEREETPAMAFGTALHCAVLEPERFAERYAPALNQDDFPGCLVTASDLSEWLKERGRPHTAKCKADLVERVLLADSSVQIWDRMKDWYEVETKGRVQLSRDYWQRVNGAAEALRNEPRLQELLKSGRPEVPIFAWEPDTQVPLKARLDWVGPDYTLDIKTFSQQRGKSIDRTVADAIWYERYHIQAYWYTRIRMLNEADGNPKKPPSFVLAFVESEPPHEVRIKVLRGTTAGNPNLYWDRARLECRELVRLYAECMEKFGEDEPWRTDQDIDPLIDEDLPGLAYGI